MKAASEDRPPVERGSPRIPYVATAAVLLGFVAVSRLIPWSRVHFPADFPPLFLNWHPLVGTGAVVPVALGAVFVLSLPRLSRLRARWMLAALVAFTALFAASLAVQSGHIRTFRGCCLPGSGTSIISAPFERDGEYFAAVDTVERLGPRAFAERFASMDRLGQHLLPLHVTTHPPGAPMFLWLLSRLVGGSVLGVSLLVALIGALGVVPTYLLAREVYGESAARAAAVLFACSPGVLVYAATSMDVVFMTAIAVALAAVVRAPRSTAWSIVAGALAAVALCLTWAAFALGVVGIGVGILALSRGAARGDVIRRGALAIAAFAATALLIRLVTGIDLVAAYGVTMDRQTHYLTYHRSYGYWMVGNVVAFLITAGLAQTALFVAGTRDRWRARRPGLETVLWITLVLASGLGVFKGETDHSWLFFLPLLVAVAGERAARLRGPATAGLAQAIATEALFYTGW